MRITTFFKKMIGLLQTIVESATLVDNQTTILKVRPRWKNHRCGKCGRKALRLHGRKGKLRTWRHLGIWGNPVLLRCQIYRVQCRRCGVTTMAVPWARTGSLFTRIFEEQVAWFMQKTNQAATAEYFHISWQTAGKIARRVIAEKLDSSLLDNLRFLGIDEIGYGRLRKFLTVVVDHERHRVVWVSPGQSRKTLNKFFQLLGPKRCAEIKAVSIDMDLAFEFSIQDYAPKAKIVYDRFHLVQLLSKAVDLVRRAEMHKVSPQKVKQLRSSRYALLKNQWNLTPLEKDKLSTIQKTNKRIYRAYLLKETFQTIFEASSVKEASVIFKNWFQWARRSALDPFAKLALTFKYRLSGILQFIAHKITNSPVEGMNSKIRMISHRAFGFRSAEGLIAMIHLNCSGIYLKPLGL